MSDNASQKVWGITTIILSIAISTFVANIATKSAKTDELVTELAVAVTNIGYIKEDSKEVLLISKSSMKELLALKQRQAILELEMKNLKESLKELKASNNE